VSVEAELPAIQRWLHDALVFPGEVKPPEVVRMLAGSGTLAAADGLAIYQRGYFLRIVRCMREQFPALCHALDEALFDDFVADYVRDRPPESHTLYDLGRRFPDWLEENRPDRDLAGEERESWIDFIVDLARFERLVFATFDAPGHEGRPYADSATPDDRLRLQPCFALGAYRFPVAVYYHQVRLGEQAPLPAPERSFVALARTDYVTRTIALDEAQYVFLAAMAGGGSVNEGIDAAARHLGLAPDEVRQAWHTHGDRRRWIECGFFIAGD
jgi:hypothetical protein